MKNTKVLEMLNSGQIEELKALLQDEIFTESLKGNGNEYRYKYMLSFMDGFAWDGFESLPCRSIAEAVDFVRNSDTR